MSERKFIKTQKKNWIISATGNDRTPCWEFKANQEKSKVLNGTLKDEILGYILNKLGNRYTLCATFEIQVNTNDIEITAQDGAWDDWTPSKEKETKIRVFFKQVLEPKLKEYLSKVELIYEKPSNS
ncbi:hypothetical protein [Okeania sp. SIO3B5]|uniref:hypothetical protein n=1 Tax=Okeania sp. SIO3B5 TaxID=2607811 RepID=UPI0025FF3E10|nr:hypothetical protein [Okeania sp. SIO3B5]